MLEGSLHPMLTELSEKRELLHHAYVLYHRALIARDAAITRTSPEPDQLLNTSVEAVTAWARTGKVSASAAASPVEEAMEAVLEDTLRKNRWLEAQLETSTRNERERREREDGHMDGVSM